jgi:1,4-alpha-glucan branching enzyme
MIKITKKGKKAWVTFTLPSTVGESVELSGEWNEWKNEAMKVKKSGEFYITKVLKTDENYEFGYLVNGNEWHCDEELGCIATPFNSNNSLLEL